MNSSAISWMSQPVMDNSMFMNQCDFMDTFMDEDFSAVLYEQDFQNYLLSPRTNSTSSSTLINIPNSNSNNTFYTPPGMEQQINQTPDNYSQFPNMHSTMIVNPDQASSAPIILNFGNHNIPSENIQQVNPMLMNPEEPVVAPEVFRSQGLMSYNVNSEEAMPKPKVQPTKKKARIRPPSQTYDHIIAERRRREQLSQLFVALSALVPGLKKMDKSSVLEDAIKYLKHLQDRVKTLEEKAEKQSMESVVLVKKSQIVFEDEGSSDEQSCSFDEQPLPEIEARVCENHILLRVHCEKEKGVLVKLLCKIESFNMIVVNTNATQFGNVALDITIIAELEKEFNLTVKEVVTGLREALVPAV